MVFIEINFSNYGGWLHFDFIFDIKLNLIVYLYKN